MIICTERAKRPSDSDAPGAAAPSILSLLRGQRGADRSALRAHAMDRRPTRRAGRSAWCRTSFPPCRSRRPNRRGRPLHKMNGIGAHEVVIESTEHGAELSTLSIEDIAAVGAYRARIVDLEGDPRFKYILVFKNHGETAGASLQHLHTQLIAADHPEARGRGVEGARSHFDMKERCTTATSSSRRWRTAAGSRRGGRSLRGASKPFAPRFPYETWILPKKHNRPSRPSRTRDSTSWRPC